MKAEAERNLTRSFSPRASDWNFTQAGFLLCRTGEMSSTVSPCLMAHAITSYRALATAPSSIYSGCELKLFPLGFNLYELFDDQLEAVEEKIRTDWINTGRVGNPFDFLSSDSMLLIVPGTAAKLNQRLRKDTKVVMHLAGRGRRRTSLPDVFSAPSSFLNKFLFFLLYTCGAFAPEFSGLESIIKNREITSRNVICRHGTDTLSHLLSMFVDAAPVKARLEAIKQAQLQSARRLWEPGFYTHLS